ncbi:hypothetical protein SDRG_08183 [Saprolegnia diclina VS20]|uniref:Uncharacterized protein n=1 Tax=Saprolegnia diclina (strain VS20) TaxID=1156394 RepID=T0RPI1_SAPDV|nr:hypothetical protein SDRG_08183 [Saprolegnia diclina VS20]EQC34413.1 hypothetical protein SDRG_08183 [Saprolegnia diclina VS20]|eukprot:XP_008612275.1 hypothetical protein SDRG_08183 [Saprolegnia diclina VS20]
MHKCYAAYVTLQYAAVPFWDRICSHEGGGSGPSYLNGWISVFCVFNDKGQWQGDKMTDTVLLRKPEANPDDWFDAVETEVTYDYPLIDMQDIPPRYLTVDVTIDDNGTEYKALMFAGHMAYSIGDNKASIAPSLSWAIALKNGEPAPPDEMELFFARRSSERAKSSASTPVGWFCTVWSTLVQRWSTSFG